MPASLQNIDTFSFLDSYLESFNSFGFCLLWLSRTTVHNFCFIWFNILTNFLSSLRLIKRPRWLPFFWSLLWLLILFTKCGKRSFLWLLSLISSRLLNLISRTLRDRFCDPFLQSGLLTNQLQSANLILQITIIISIICFIILGFAHFYYIYFNNFYLIRSLNLIHN